MKNFYTEEEWNEILKKQEEVLRYETFTRKQALELGLLNKAFDPYERQLAADVIAARIPREACRGQLMED